MSVKDLPGPSDEQEASRGLMWLRGRLALLSKTGFGGRSSATRPGMPTPDAARLRTGLMTIRNLAAFVQQNPDMPRPHREKIIQSLIRESEELKSAAERITCAAWRDCARP